MKVGLNPGMLVLLSTTEQEKIDLMSLASEAIVGKTRIKYEGCDPNDYGILIRNENREVVVLGDKQNDAELLLKVSESLAHQDGGTFEGCEPVQNNVKLSISFREE